MVCFSQPTKKTNILVLGFYNRANLGDEAYKIAFKQIFPSKTYSLSFACTDDVHHIPRDTDIIVCGGGDIVNEYFMSKVKLLATDFAGPMYAISVGVPHERDAHYLTLFDHVFARSNRDAKIARSVLGDVCVTRIPDITSVFIGRAHTRRSLGICLATPVLEAHPEVYTTILDTIKKFLDADPANTVHLFAFNSFDLNERESDMTYINDVISKFPDKCHRIRRETSSSPQKIMGKLARMDGCICMRFHSVVFCHEMKVPFVAMYTSPKIGSFLADNKIEGLKIGTEFNLEWHVNRMLRYDAWRSVKSIQTMVELQNVRVSKYKMITHNDMGSAMARILGALQPRVQSFGPHITHSQAKDLAAFINYTIEGSVDGPCVWGLTENIRKPEFDLQEAVEYIQNDYLNRLATSVKDSSHSQLKRLAFVSIDPHVDNTIKHCHRSGWAYVLQNMMAIHAPNFARTPKLIVDTYVDRTFTWGASALKTSKKIPWTSPWIGFVHHTFDTKFDENHNCVKMFQEPAFIASLSHCKGLIALSDYLAGKLKAGLESLGFPKIPVHTLRHPTELVESVFTMQKYQCNKQRKVMQVGSWLRNPESFEKLKCKTPKLVLCGKKVTMHPQGAAPRGKAIESVPWVSNEEYDEYLSKNIVFLDLVDCSAANTVLECIARNTPIVVNRHPAIIECLGEHYPGLYNTLDEAAALIDNVQKIELMHMYLQRMDKTDLKVDTFMKKFQEIIVQS